MKSLLKLLALALTFATALLPTGASAQIVVDQSNPTMNEFIYNEIYTSSPTTFFSQSFIPSMNNIAGAYAEIYPWVFPDDITMTIFDVNPAINATNPLATGTTTINAGGGVSVYWSSIAVTPGNTYFLRLQSSGSVQQINTTRDNLYPNGALYVGTDVWWGGLIYTHDLTFKTYADTNFTPVPEPSTYAALFGLTALGFAAYRRRRRQSV